MDKSANVGTRPGDAERPHEFGAAAPGRGGRMSRQRKTAAVLRATAAELGMKRRLPEPDEAVLDGIRAEVDQAFQRIGLAGFYG